jgi:hypothetical protein
VHHLEVERPPISKTILLKFTLLTRRSNLQLTSVCIWTVDRCAAGGPFNIIFPFNTFVSSLIVMLLELMVSRLLSCNYTSSYLVTTTSSSLKDSVLASMGEWRGNILLTAGVCNLHQWSLKSRNTIDELQLATSTLEQFCFFSVV